MSDGLTHTARMPELIPGSATGEGTARYAARRARHAAPGHFRSWEGLAMSSVGLGTYLGDDDGETDRAYQAAVARTLERGLNVIDSAINYRHQRSERSVGAALRTLIDDGVVARDEVLLATKGGFIPFDGALPADPHDYVFQTYVRPRIALARDIVGGCHCLAPGYLADQIERSRANLGVETIDVYYLHNPEMQLAKVDRPTFLARMRAAFTCLEGAAAQGKIHWYGTATWTGYRQPSSAGDFLSLAELARLAEEVAGRGHRFRVVQMPYNLAMTEAFTLTNQALGEEAVSVLEAARQLGMYVMTSASIYQGQLAQKLPPIVAEFLPGLDTDAQRAVQFVRSTPGVGTALVGMRAAAHVDENARVAGVAPLAWEAFRRLFSET